MRPHRPHTRSSTHTHTHLNTSTHTPQHILTHTSTHPHTLSSTHTPQHTHVNTASNTRAHHLTHTHLNTHTHTPSQQRSSHVNTRPFMVITHNRMMSSLIGRAGDRAPGADQSDPASDPGAVVLHQTPPGHHHGGHPALRLHLYPALLHPQLHLVRALSQSGFRGPRPGTRQRLRVYRLLPPVSL